jgi:hypothetical protein
MWEKHFKKGREVYVIELVIAVTRTVSQGTGEVSLEPLIWSESNGFTPMGFKTKQAANRYASRLLNGETTLDIRAFSIRRVCLTVPKVKQSGKVESTGG